MDARRFRTHAVGIEVPPTGRLLLRSGYHFISLVAIVVFLVMGMTAFRAVMLATAIQFAVAFLDRATWWTPRRVWEAAASGALGVLSVTSVMAIAGIIVGVMTLTGLGLKLANIIVDLAGANLFLTALYSAVAVMVLGLAVPVTASFIISWVIIGPALTQLGVPSYAAAMFIFYYAVLSEVSPPTALSPFAAAAITGGRPVKTMWLTWKYTLPAFLIPFVFVLASEGEGLLLQGDLATIAIATVSAALGVAGLAVATGAWLLGPAGWPERVLFGLGGLGDDGHRPDLHRCRPGAHGARARRPPHRPAKERAAGGDLMDLGLRGRRAVVGGATSGLGRASADALAAEGCDLLIWSRSEERLAETAAGLRDAHGGSVEHVVADAADPSAAAIVAEAARSLGPIDILVLNAGGPPTVDPAATEREGWERAFQLLATTPIELATLLLPGMRDRGWGRVVGILSSSVRQPVPDLVYSTAGRSALAAWLKTVARAAAADGVTVNGVMPGRIATQRVHELDAGRAEREGTSEEQVRQSHLATIPAGRYGQPEELGALVAFLCFGARVVRHRAAGRRRRRAHRRAVGSVAMDERERALRRAAEIGLDYLASLPERHVGARADATQIRERLPAALPEGPMEPRAVIEELAAAVDPGIVASGGPRYFGFVVGGTLPAAAAADWLTAAWGQNAVVHALSPAAAAVEETRRRLDAGAARPAARRERRPAHRRRAGQRGRARRRAPRGAGPGGLGRRGQGAVRGARDHGHRRRGGARHPADRPPVPRPRPRPGRPRSHRRPGAHAGGRRARRHRCGRRARSSSPPRPAT